MTKQRASYIRGDVHGFRYKIDVLEAMKEKGYTSYKIRKEKLIDEAQLTKIRSGEIASKETLKYKAIYTLVSCAHYAQETSVFFCNIPYIHPF